MIFGPPGSAYEGKFSTAIPIYMYCKGGVYHGKVKFPPEYPHKPPSIIMLIMVKESERSGETPQDRWGGLGVEASKDKSSQ